MKKLLFACAAAVGIMTSCSAYAADLPVKIPIAATPVYNWTGCYVV